MALVIGMVLGALLAGVAVVASVQVQSIRANRHG
jgi:hypothetical protein